MGLFSVLCRIFDLPSKLRPSESAAWKLGNALFHVERALSTKLSYADAQTVIWALDSYVKDQLREVPPKKEDEDESNKD